MNFNLTEDQKMMRKMVRDFVEEEVIPQAAHTDETHEFPLALVHKMRELGLLGIPIPEEYGGAGSDFTSYTLALEEIARGCASTAVIMAVHTTLGTFPIYYFGNEEQKQKYLPKLAKGEMLGAFALTEPNSGSDASSLVTTAKRRGDHYVINGSKRFISNTGYAGIYTVLASTDRTKGSRGITAFLVDADTPGLIIGKKEKKMGLHGSSTRELIFEDMVVPVENRLGEEGQGFKIAMALLDDGRIGIGAQAVG
ncbi:MAG: acyl-CoA dehydrogenase family protein, partial [Desulfitobacterium hafniense]